MIKYKFLHIHQNKISKFQNNSFEKFIYEDCISLYNSSILNNMASTIKTKSKKERTILHYPKLDSILMVEKVIQDFKSYPTRTELWKSLPKQMQYQTFKLILKYLEDSNKITFENSKIIWIFPNNKKLRKLIDEAISI